MLAWHLKHPTSLKALGSHHRMTSTEETGFESSVNSGVCPRSQISTKVRKKIGWAGRRSVFLSERNNIRGSPRQVREANTSVTVAEH